MFPLSMAIMAAADLRQPAMDAKRFRDKKGKWACGSCLRRDMSKIRPALPAKKPLKRKATSRHAHVFSRELALNTSDLVDETNSVMKWPLVSTGPVVIAANGGEHVPIDSQSDDGVSTYNPLEAISVDSQSQHSLSSFYREWGALPADTQSDDSVSTDTPSEAISVDTPSEVSVSTTYNPVPSIDVISDDDSGPTPTFDELGQTVLGDAVDRALEQFETKEAKRLVKEFEALERLEMQETEKLIRDYEVISLDTEHEPAAVDEGFEVLELPL